MKHDKLPDVEFSGKNCDEIEGVAFEIESYTVYEWTPERDAQGKPTQVHMHIDVKGFPVPCKFVLRFKDRGGISKMIGALERHRDAVWPAAH